MTPGIRFIIRTCRKRHPSIGRKIPILAIVERKTKLEKSGRGLKRSRHTSMLVLGMIGIKWKKKKRKGTGQRTDSIGPEKKARD